MGRLPQPCRSLTASGTIFGVGGKADLPWGFSQDETHCLVNSGLCRRPFGSTLRLQNILSTTLRSASFVSDVKKL